MSRSVRMGAEQSEEGIVRYGRVTGAGKCRSRWEGWGDIRDCRVFAEMDWYWLGLGALAISRTRNTEGKKDRRRWTIGETMKVEGRRVEEG